jgi:hypothetical protein
MTLQISKQMDPDLAIDLINVVLLCCNPGDVQVKWIEPTPVKDNSKNHKPNQI